MLWLRWVFLLAVMASYTFTTVSINAGHGQYCASHVLPGNRLLIMHQLCGEMNVITRHCGNRTDVLVARVFDNSIPPLLLQSSYLSFSPLGDALAPGIIGVEFLNNNTWVYVTWPYADPNSVFKFEVLPNNTVVQRSQVDLVLAGTATFSRSGTLNPINRVLYCWGRYASNLVLSITKINLTDFTEQNQVTIPTNRPAHYAPYVNDTAYGWYFWGTLLVDSEYGMLVFLGFDVLLIDGADLTVQSSILVQGTLLSGAIDEAFKKVYYLDQIDGTLWQLGYNRTNIWQEFSYQYTPGASYPTKCDVIFDASLHLLYVLAGQRLDTYPSVKDLDIWEPRRSFDKPLTSVSDLPLGYFKSSVSLIGSALVVLNSFFDDEMALLAVPVGIACAQNTSGCVSCSPGTFFNATSRSCPPCPVKTYSPNYAMTSCLVCAQPSDDKRICDPCPQNSQAVGSNCECSPGFTLDPDHRCSKCGKGTYKATPGDDHCLVCPDGSTTDPEHTACTCGAQYFAVWNGSDLVCNPCPYGASCDGTAEFSSEPSFWRPRNSSLQIFVQCPNPSACASKDVCAPSYAQEALLCGACAEGFAVTSSLEGCVACQSTNPWILTLFCVLAPIFIARLYSSNGDGSGFVNIAILINHLQVLAELGLWENGDAEPEVKSLVTFLRVFQFQFLSWSSNLCAFPGRTFMAQWLPQLFVTLMLLLLSAVVALFLQFRKKADILNRFIRVSLTILKFGFIGNTKLILMAFICSSSDTRGTPYVKDGEAVRVFSRYPDLVCFEGEHSAIAGVAIAFLFVYVLSTVGILSWLLFKSSSVNIAFLTSPYTTKRRYWELVVLARRFAVAVVAVTTQSLTRNWMLALIIFLSLGGSLLSEPYDATIARRFDVASLLVLYASFSFAVLMRGSQTADLALLIFIVSLNVGLLLGALFLICRLLGGMLKIRAKLSGVELSR